MGNKPIQPTAEQPTTASIDALMRKVEARSRKSTGWQFVAIILILIAVIIGVVGIYKQTAISKGIQTTQQNQQQATLEARKANIARQQQLADYVKCLALSKFDYPAEQFTTRKGTEIALDKCAKTNP